jgi:hypothetical protein
VYKYIGEKESKMETHSNSGKAKYITEFTLFLTKQLYTNSRSDYHAQKRKLFRTPEGQTEKRSTLKAWLVSPFNRFS